MRTLAAILLVAGVIAGTAAACVRRDPEPARGHVADELIVRRAHYDTSRPFHELVKPHFFAMSKDGDLVEARGDPDLVVERDGVVKIRLKDGKQALYLDLLVLESELLGEHPVHKVFRLQDMGVPVGGGLARRLRPEGFADGLFHSLDFEYRAGKETGGVIAEVFADGTFLVIPFDLPPEWRGQKPDDAEPSHLHVDPRAVSVADSALAREFEEEILALPFDDQRYPPVELARKQCGVYDESLEADKYVRLLSSVGYRFTPAHVLQQTEESPRPSGQEIWSILWESSGGQTRYFGFQGYWAADRASELGADWTGECDAAFGVRRYRKPGDDQYSFYTILRRSLEPDTKQRYKIVSIAADGSAKAIYTAPGIILTALPLPFDGDFWMVSSEGWPPPGDDTAPDPRWQSVYLVDIRTPEAYEIVGYPISRYPKAPEAGLYGSSSRLNEDGSLLYNILYGFEDEGGGLWVADLSEKGFYADPESFARIAAWDHALSWMLLRSETEGDSRSMTVFLTGKEVAGDAAMTANVLRIRNAGLDSVVEHRERLLRMVGWNPVPFALQRLPDGGFVVAVETHYSYESSLLPRAKGVYVVTVAGE